MKRQSIAFAVMFAFVLVFTSCKKEFDNPPYKPVNDGAQLTIAKLKNRVSDPGKYKFGNGDSNLYCIVIADETSGNIYKQVFVKDDESNAIQVNLVNPGGLYTGDRIRINLNGISLVSANSMVSIDSVDVEKSVVKLSSGNSVIPKVVTLDAVISQNDPLLASGLQSQLVEINGVEFQPAYRGKPFGDVIGKGSVDLILENCTGKTAFVHTSGFANFAGKLAPAGNGKIVAIVSRYKQNTQLIIRNYNEVQMTNTPCSAPTFTGTSYLNKDFNTDSLTADGWININVMGSINWVIKTSAHSSNPTKVMECNNFISSGNQPACETWFISKSINLSGAIAPTFSFSSAYLFSGPQLQAMISTNYTAGAPSGATWASLPIVIGSSGGAFTSSGTIDLSAYKTANVRIAFKYTGNLNSGSRWQVDNIRVFEQ